MLIFTVVFSRVAKLPSDGVAPYPVMVFAGMLPWFLFSTILSEASSSMVLNSNLIGKVYFPRLIVPSATIVVALVDFAITFVLLLVMMWSFGFSPLEDRALTIFRSAGNPRQSRPGSLYHSPKRQVS